MFGAFCSFVTQQELLIRHQGRFSEQVPILRVGLDCEGATCTPKLCVVVTYSSDGLQEQPAVCPVLQVTFMVVLVPIIASCNSPSAYFYRLEVAHPGQLVRGLSWCCLSYRSLSGWL